jgi:hypothetical protein
LEDKDCLAGGGKEAACNLEARLEAGGEVDDRLEAEVEADDRLEVSGEAEDLREVAPDGKSDRLFSDLPRPAVKKAKKSWISDWHDKIELHLKIMRLRSNYWPYITARTVCI